MKYINRGNHDIYSKGTPFTLYYIAYQLFFFLQILLFEKSILIRTHLERQ